MRFGMGKLEKLCFSFVSALAFHYLCIVRREGWYPPTGFAEMDNPSPLIYDKQVP